MSMRTFQRRFQKATGASPGDWLVTERVRLAQEHLELNVHASLEEVTGAYGFGSLETMRDHFRKKIGVVATVYRRRTPPKFEMVAGEAAWKMRY
jgi:AraC family transcriptional regulator, transcriptional activator FtrA